MPSSAGRTLISTGLHTVSVLCSRFDSIRSPYRVLFGASSWPRLMGRDNIAMHERCWEGPFKHWAPYVIELARENEQRCHPLCGLAHVQARLGCSPEPPEDPRKWAARRSEETGRIKVAIHERCWEDRIKYWAACGPEPECHHTRVLSGASPRRRRRHRHYA